MKLQIFAGWDACPSCGWPFNVGFRECSACGQYCQSGQACGGYAYATTEVNDKKVCGRCRNKLLYNTTTKGVE